MTHPAALEALLRRDPALRPPGRLAASLTHAWRSLLKIKHLPEQLFNITALPLLLTVVFAGLFGGAIAGSVGGYIQYFLPGVLVLVVTLVTMYTGSGLTVDAATGYFDRLRTLPTWQPAAIVGSLLGDLVRYTAAAVVVISLGLALGYRPGGGVGGMILGTALVLVFAFSISWAWSALGLVVSSERTLHGLSMMVMFPLTFGSNIFVDPATMPSWLEGVVAANPISRLVTSTRELMAGATPTAEIGWTLLAAALLVAAFAPLTMRLYRTRS